MTQWKFLVATYCLMHFLDRNYDSIFPAKFSLVIGIMSAQEHFDRRNALRKTWLKSLIHSRKVKYYFVIGKHSCPVPAEDRPFIEECSDWSSNFLDSADIGRDHFVVGAANKDKENSNINNILSKHTSEFIFIVNFDIIVSSFGIVSEVIKNNKESIFVKIYDHKNSALLGTVFTKTSCSDDYLSWVKAEHLFLPKGFEGRVRIEGNGQPLVFDSISCPQVNGAQISVVQILHPDSNKSCFLVGFKYFLKDASTFNKFISKRVKRIIDRQNQVIQIKDSLDEESSLFQDILLLDVIDVYRNLPIKVISFFHWTAENIAFDFILKTDDDTLINIDRVLAEVEDSIQHQRSWDWWSCFRSGWPVMDIGKWREYNFISHTYPEFPSGAGYVLRKNLVEYLSTNFDSLYKHFQGEDVSLGIWMSPILPVKHFGKFCHWACDNIYRAFSCNAANLDVTEFSRYWKFLSKS